MARLLGGLLLLTLAITAHAADIAVSGTYARATPPGATVGAVYFELRNTGGEPDRLLSAAAPVAARTEVHTHTMQDGVARMHEVPAVELPAGATVQFQPGGFHIMLIELKAPLTEGESFPLTLNFERAGELSLTVPVQKITALMPPHGGGHSHGHGRHH